MSEFWIFVSGFGLVFFLGLQSQIVNHGHTLYAFFTSVAIGVMHLILYKMVPEANVTEMVAFVLSGACGIITSIHVFRWLKSNPLWKKSL